MGYEEPSEFPLEIILQCYDHASVRISCKHMIKNFSDYQQEEEEIDSFMSSVAFAREDFDDMREMMRNRGKNLKRLDTSSLSAIDPDLEELA